MSSPQDYTDLSHLYGLGFPDILPKTRTSSAHNQVGPASSAPSGPCNSTGLWSEQQLLERAMEAPAARLHLTAQSISRYENAMASPGGASNLLRQYDEMRRLEAATSLNLPCTSGNPSIIGASLHRTAPAGLVNQPAWDVLPNVSPLLASATLATLPRPFSVLSSGTSSIGMLPDSIHDALSLSERPLEDKISTTKKAQVLMENEAAFFQSSDSKERFPLKLYRMIYEVEKAGRSDVIAFLPHGRAFAIHDEKAFVSEILPLYFANCQLPSFQKQLNLYGFHKIKFGKDKGKLRYFHASFLKGRPSLTNKIHRKRGTGKK